MTEPTRPVPPAPAEHPEPTQLPELPAAEPAPDAAPTGWGRRAKAGTALVIAFFVAVGIFAAWTVTPGPDEEALPRPDGSDVVIAGGTPLSWDPAAISDGLSAQLLAQVYEGITVLDAGSQVRPALAESWRVEADGHRIVFQLRDGAAFSDGSALTAADVRRSWLRVIDPARPSPLASLLDVVAGASAYARGEAGVQQVGLEADGQVLTVTFEHPASYFPAVAATPTLAVVPRNVDEQARGPAPGEAFVASGAYVPVEQELGEVRLERNEHYWASPVPMARVTVLTDDGGRTAVDIFEDETVDWTEVNTSDASWISYDRYLGPQLRYTDEMAVELLGFDASEPPFHDPAARRAVALAVDWRALAALDDGGAVPTSIVPPGVASRGDQDYLLPHDPDAARAALAAAGFPGGGGFPAVTLATYGVGPAEAIAEQLRRELGIEVRVEQRSFEDHGFLLEHDTPDLWTLAWSADYPHAHDFLGLLLTSDSSANLGRWSDEQYDQLISAASATDDPREQERLYGEAQVIVREEAPLIPLGYGGRWWLSRDGLRGGQVSGVGLMRYAELAWAGR